MSKKKSSQKNPHNDLLQELEVKPTLLKPDRFEALLSIKDEADISITQSKDPQKIEEKFRNFSNALLRFSQDNLYTSSQEIVNYLSETPGASLSDALVNPHLTRLGHLLQSEEKSAYLNNFLNSDKKFYKPTIEFLKEKLSLSYLDTENKEPLKNIFNENYNPIDYRLSYNLLAWQLLEKELQAKVKEHWISEKDIYDQEKIKFFSARHKNYWLNLCTGYFNISERSAFNNMLTSREKKIAEIKDLNEQLNTELPEINKKSLTIRKEEKLKNLAQSHWQFRQDPQLQNLYNGSRFDILATCWITAMWALPIADKKVFYEELLKPEDCDSELCLHLLLNQGQNLEQSASTPLAFISLYYPVLSDIPHILEKNKILVEKLSLTKNLETISPPATNITKKSLKI